MNPAQIQTQGSGFVYFIQAGKAGPIKIGWAYDPAYRLAQLQIGNHETLHIIATVEGDATLERNRPRSRHRPVRLRRSSMDDAHTQPRRLNLPERIELARALKRHGLGHVRLPGLTTDTPPCMGKANGCHHACCVTTPQPAPDAVIQPWDPRPARHAA